MAEGRAGRLDRRLGRGFRVSLQDRQRLHGGRADRLRQCRGGESPLGNKTSPAATLKGSLVGASKKGGPECAPARVTASLSLAEVLRSVHSPFAGFSLCC